MTTFDIGDVPQGWKRGQKLRVERYLDKPENYVIASIWLDEPYSFNDKVLPNDVAALTVTRADIDRANAWIKWWSAE